MNAGIFSTPRSVPSRLAPTVAGGLVIFLALPVFAVAGWPLEGWALAAVLWVAAEVFALVLARLPGSADNLAAAGMRGIGTTSRALLVGIPLEQGLEIPAGLFPDRKPDFRSPQRPLVA